MFGGRAARPYQFMSGLTSFNSDLFEAEHLMIEDEQASLIFVPGATSAQPKNITATEWQRGVKIGWRSVFNRSGD